jgi:hypothetical protein
MKNLQRVEDDLPPAEYLHALGLAYVDFAVSNPDFYLLMFTRPPSQVTVEGLIQEGSSFPILLAAVRRGIEEGAFQTRPGFGAMEMTYAAWSLVHGLAMLRLTYLQEGPLDFQIADSEVLRTLYVGLQAR